MKNINHFLTFNFNHRPLVLKYLSSSCTMKYQVYSSPKPNLDKRLKDSRIIFFKKTKHCQISSAPVSSATKILSFWLRYYDLAYR